MIFVSHKHWLFMTIRRHEERRKERGREREGERERRERARGEGEREGEGCFKRGKKWAGIVEIQEEREREKGNVKHAELSELYLNQYNATCYY